MHLISEPSILYFGTPVVLISTLNEDGTYNLAPMSSVFWLGWRCMIGLSALSKTSENIRFRKQCVLNLPSQNEVTEVNRLALTTGKDPVPEAKSIKGYQYVKDKFNASGLTPLPSVYVEAPRVKECPVHLEAELMDTHSLAEDNPMQRGRILSFELRIVKVHLASSILMKGFKHRVDPDLWKPLIMSFQHFYGLGNQLQNSRLAEIPESLYRTSDVDLVSQR
jgi:flavin reductase (DIM6/NTAB) family NADH-FMN oxidoreductase RutF